MCRSTYYVFGGTPPYTVAASLPTFVTITGSPIAASGGGFTARATACVDPETFTITDASGRFINATLSSILGPAETTGGGGNNCSFSPPAPGCPTVNPAAVTLTACTGAGSSATVNVTSTTAPVVAATSGLSAPLSGSSSPYTVTITRTSGAALQPATVTVSAGSLSQTVSVTLTGAAAGSCP